MSLTVSSPQLPTSSSPRPVFAVSVQADVHAREQQIRAHAQFIVLTENAVGFENGGQCVPSNRETYPLYVSKAAANKLLSRSCLKVLPACAPMRVCISCIPQLLCVCVENMVLFLAL